MYRSILVPLDLDATGDRALPFAAALAAAHALPLELVTVSSPGMPEMEDRLELEQRARSTGVHCSTTVLHANDAADAILSLAANRPDSLLVMATRARGAIGQVVLGSVSEEVLSRSERPVVMIGPRVVNEDISPSPTLVIGVGDGRVEDVVVPAVTSWHESFGGPRPWVVEVRSPTDAEPGDDAHPSLRSEPITAGLSDEGIESECSVIRAKRPADGLIEFADRVADAVLVVASSRWTDPGGAHITSTGRRSVQLAHHPVLVVPSSRVVTAHR